MVWLGEIWEETWGSIWKVGGCNVSWIIFQSLLGSNFPRPVTLRVCASYQARPVSHIFFFFSFLFQLCGIPSCTRNILCGGTTAITASPISSCSQRIRGKGKLWSGMQRIQREYNANCILCICKEHNHFCGGVLCILRPSWRVRRCCVIPGSTKHGKYCLYTAENTASILQGPLLFLALQCGDRKLSVPKCAHQICTAYGEVLLPQALRCCAFAVEVFCRIMLVSSVWMMSSQQVERLLQPSLQTLLSLPVRRLLLIMRNSPRT